MTKSSQRTTRKLTRRERMSEQHMTRSLSNVTREVGPEDLGPAANPEEWAFAHNVLRNPSLGTLERALEAAATKANGTHRVRRVATLPPEPVLKHPHGILEDNGDPESGGGFDTLRMSVVGVAWVTLGEVKYVRMWGQRGFLSGVAHSFAFLPKPSNREGLRSCWALTFPRRFSKLVTLRVERRRRILERIGLPGSDDRVNLVLRSACIRTHVPGLGVILTDDLARPRLVQVVVRDPSTGFRHHLTVPPRFGNPKTKTFRMLGSSAARIQAALAWTFGLKPEAYAPALEV